MPYRAEHIVLETEPVELKRDETLDQAVARTKELNEQRRQDIVNFLVANQIPDAGQRVVLAPVARAGVHGVEAPRVYNQLLRTITSAY